MDNFKLWYLMKRNASRASGAPPLTFKSNGESLKKWQIYGNALGVGEQTRNILPSPASESVGTTTINGVTITVTKEGEVYLSGIATKDVSFTVNLSTLFVIPSSVSQGGGGTISFNNNRICSVDNFGICFKNENNNVDIWRLNLIDRKHNSYTTMSNKTIDRYVITVAKGYTIPTGLYFALAFSNDGQFVSPYEPYGYKIPITCGGETTNIYIGENPLDDGESISSAEAGTEIPTVSGTNVLTVGTAVQPMRVSIRAEPDMPAPLNRYLYSKYILNNE